MPLPGKTGILIVNLGTPDSPERKDVYTYLKQFLTDYRVIDIPWLQRNLLVRGIIAPFRSGSSAKLYKKLWLPAGSPLKIYGMSLSAKVQQILGNEFVVRLAMRYQNPSIEKALMELRAEHVSKIVIFPLFPQYASASTGSFFEEVMRILSKWQAIPALQFVQSYHDHPEMIDAYVENARKYDLADYDHILFSFHGIPQRQMIKADDCNHCLQTADCCQTITVKNQFCYSAQSHSTAFALAEKLGIPKNKYTISFQSRLGRDPWMQPYTVDVIKDLAKVGVKKVLVFCPAFTSDCLETTIEIEDEYRNEFISLGGEKMDLVESLNDSDNWANIVAKMLQS
ncbi:MAG: ferrochelatase [Saprospiraceae bacterium]